jgi:hypothetical protein
MNKIVYDVVFWHDITDGLKAALAFTPINRVSSRFTVRGSCSMFKLSG